MSLDATRWAWSRQGLRPAQKLVLLSLADRAGEDNTCWPSMERVRRDTGLDIKTVRACLAVLAEAGLLSRRESSGRGYVYTLSGVARREDAPTRNATPAGNGAAPVRKAPPPPPETDPSPAGNGGLIYQEPITEPPREAPSLLRRDGVPAVPAPAAPPLFLLPLKSAAREKAREYAVSQELFDIWAEACPLVDVARELKSIRAWLVSNPARRPRSDMPRFVNAWLAREQNKLANREALRGQPGQSGRSGPEPKTFAEMASERAWAEFEHEYKFDASAERIKSDFGEASGRHATATPAPKGACS